MMESGLQFNPILSFWIIIPLIFAGIYLSWYTYSKTIQNNTLKYVLTLLRSISFIILIALLLQPQFISEKQRFKKSSLAILTDNSESTTIQNGVYKGLNSYKPVLDLFNEIDTTEVDIELYSIGTGINGIQQTKDLTFSEGETDLFETFNSLVQSDKEYSAALLVSDGIYTINRDPIYAVQEVDFPIYSIALGDTLPVKDIILKNVNSPSIAYKNAPLAIPITIQKSGYDSNLPLVIRISENENLIAKKTLTFPKESNFLVDTLKFTPKQLGINRWKIAIQTLSDEFTDQNNTSSFTLRVLDNKNKIAHIAFSIHPDVKTIRTILQEIENAELISRTWIGKSSFLEGTLSGLIDSTQLLILHGYPALNLPDNLKLQIDSWIEKIPTIFIDLPQQQRDYTSAVGSDKKPIQSSLIGSISTLGLSLNELEINHPILDLPDIELNQIKVLGYSRGDQIKQRGRVLLYFTQNASSIQQPAIGIFQDSDKRYAQINFHSFFQLYQQGKDEQLFIKSLIKNTVEWTSTKLINSLLEIQLPNRDIQENETFDLSALLKNESLQPISNAVVSIQIKRNNSEITNTTLTNSGNGNYSKLLGPFSDGVYQFNATATLNEKLIDSELGSFTVSAITNEYRSIKRNAQTLTNLAELTNGKTTEFTQAEPFINELIQKLTSSKQIEYQLEEWNLIQSYWWLIVLLLTLTSEWLLRKLKALP